jgi:WD40 repeat protein
MADADSISDINRPVITNAKVESIKMRVRYLLYGALSILLQQLLIFIPNLTLADDYDRFRVFNSELTQVSHVTRISSDRIYNMIFSPDGNVLVTGHSDPWITKEERNTKEGGINLWDALTFLHLAALQGQSAIVSGLSITPDGDLLVSSDHDGTVQTWDMHTHQLVTTMKEEGRQYLDLAILQTGDSFILAGTDKLDLDALQSNDLEYTKQLMESLYEKGYIANESAYYLQQRDLKSGRLTRSFAGHTGTVDEIELSPDGKTIASVSYDHSLRIWDIKSGKQEKLVFEGDRITRVNGLSFTADGEQLAYSTVSEVFISDLETLDTTTIRFIGAYDLEFLPGDRYLLVYEFDHLAIYDVRSRERVLDVSREETNAMVTAHAVSPDGKALVLALEDKNLKDRFLVQIDLHVNP